MSLQREFELYLDKEWPLWRDPKNSSSPLAHKLRKAFMAGARVGAEGPTVNGLGLDPGEPINVFEAANRPKRKFKVSRGGTK